MTGGFMRKRYVPAVGDAVEVHYTTTTSPGTIISLGTGGDVKVKLADGVLVTVRASRLTAGRPRATLTRAPARDVTPERATSQSVTRALPGAGRPGDVASDPLPPRTSYEHPQGRTGIPKSAPARSRAYLAWIRLRSCAWCPTPPPCDPHHFGPRGKGQKTDDFRTVPLCRRCHDQFHDHGTIGGMSPLDTRSWITNRILDLLIEWLKAER